MLAVNNNTITNIFASTIAGTILIGNIYVVSADTVSIIYSAQPVYGDELLYGAGNELGTIAIDNWVDIGDAYSMKTEDLNGVTYLEPNSKENNGGAYQSFPTENGVSYKVEVTLVGASGDTDFDKECFVTIDSTTPTTDISNSLHETAHVTGTTPETIEFEFTATGGTSYISLRSVTGYEYPHASYFSVREIQTATAQTTIETTNSLILDTSGWEEITIEVADIESTVNGLTENTIVHINNGNIDNNITISNSNNIKILLKAVNILEVRLNAKATISMGTNDLSIEGWLGEAYDSKIETFGARTKMIRCRFDGVNGGGQNQWIKAQCPDGGDINENGTDCEVWYSEFLNYTPTEDTANSTIFMFVYKGQTHVTSHKVKYCLFKNYNNYSNGREPLSLYTASSAGGWDLTKTDGEIMHSCEVTNNVFINCQTDNEIVKGGITGTVFKDIYIENCQGCLSFRMGRGQLMENIFIDGKNYGESFVGHLTVSDCTMRNVVAINIGNEGVAALDTIRERDNYEGGKNITIDNCYIEGGKYTFRFFDYYDEALDGSETMTITNSTFLAHADSLGIFEAGSDYDLSLITSSGNSYYGSPLGTNIGNLTELTDKPSIPDTSFAPSESDVGIYA